MEIIIHMGMVKTGTSSIQLALLDQGNANLLKGANYVALPKDFLEMCTLSRYFSNSKAWLDYLVIRGESNEAVANLKMGLLEKIKKASLAGENVIISSESLYLLSEDELFGLKKTIDQLISNADYKVVFCVREKVSLAVSASQQIVKTHDYEPEFKEFLRFREPLQRFEKVFGKENLLVYSFEEAKKEDLVRFFFKKIGLDESVVKKIKSYNVNESSSQISIEILDYMRKTIPKMLDGRRNESRDLYQNIREKFIEISGDKFNVTTTEAEKIHQANYEDVNWLYENYGMDYRKSDFSKYPLSLNDEMTKEQSKELTEIYVQSNHLERKLILDFILMKANKSSESTYRTLLDELATMETEEDKLLEKYKGRQIVLWGAGVNAKRALEFFTKFENGPLVFVDKDVRKIGGSINGISVISPIDFYNQYPKGIDVFITTKNEKAYAEIQNELNENGFNNVHHLV